MTILDFNLVLPGAPSRTAALDERDRLVSLLKENGYQLIMTEDGTRVLMEQLSKPRPKVAPCTCCCNPPPGLNCGGCGHAGCGRRNR